MPFVEQVVQSAFALDALIGLALVIALSAMLVTAAAGLVAHNGEREAFAAFGATWRLHHVPVSRVLQSLLIDAASDRGFPAFS